MTNILVVNGVVLPPPAELTLDDYDITKATRNAKGVMIMEMVRPDIHKLNCAWNYIRPDKYVTIRNAIKNKNYLNVQYFIAETNQTGTIIAYVGDRKLSVYSMGGDEPLYEKFTVNFIEM